MSQKRLLYLDDPYCLAVDNDAVRASFMRIFVLSHAKRGKIKIPVHLCPHYKQELS
jgi:hypothetical protein